MDADRAPLLFAIGGLNENTSARTAAGGGIEDSDFVVLETNFLETGIKFSECRTQGLVQRIHRAVAFGDGMFSDAVHLDFDAGLANGSCAVASHRDVVALDFEWRFLV